MLSRIAFLRIVAVAAVLTVGGVAGAKMRHYSSSTAGDVQLASLAAAADASTTTADVAITGRAMFPIGVPKDVASHSESHAPSAPVALDRLRDLDQLKTTGTGSIVFGGKGYGRNGGSSSAFGGHGFAGGGASFGSIGMGSGRTTDSNKSTTSTATTVAAKTPAAKPPAASAPAPRGPSAAPPAPAVIPPTVAAPSLPAPALVAPPIFASQLTPIPVLAGAVPNSDPAPLAGAVGGGSVPSKGPNLSATPEPASLLLIATGLVAIVGVRRRRQPTP